VISHVTNLLLTYRSLLPSPTTLYTPSPQALLTLSGTVPITYKGSTYNIPVDLYIPLSYPVSSPRVYVRPTPTMSIKPNHKHVDSEGLLYTPYLSSWTPSTRPNLDSLVREIRDIFGSEPPVYATPTPGGGGQQQHQQRPQPPSYGSVSSSSSSTTRGATSVSASQPPNYSTVTPAGPGGKGGEGS